MKRIYLDYNATTPLDPEVLAAMQPYLTEIFGNPSSLHWAGAAARKGLDEARGTVARLFNVTRDELFFTSGGTEAANLAIKGVLGRAKLPAHLIVSTVEHHSVLEPIRTLEQQGKLEVSWVPVDRDGILSAEEIAKLIRPATALIAVMFANNETGNIYPINAIGNLARAHKIPLFCDGVQAVGKLPIDLKLLPIDLFSFSAHKFYGPKGAGALYVRKGIALSPLLEGGSQESNRRGGTENLAGIIGLAVSLERAYRGLAAELQRAVLLRNQLQEGVLDIPGSRLYGDPDHRLPNTLQVGFEGIDSEVLLVALDQAGIAASNGSACTSGTLEPSHVLMAMGYSVREARGAVRFSLGRNTTEAEIAEVVARLPKIVERLRGES